MQSTIVGLFDSQGEADQARTKLIAAGFDATASSVHPDASGRLEGAGGASGLAAGTTAGSTAEVAPAEREGVVARFLHKLFGSDDTETDASGHSGAYREAFRRGAYAVTVDTMSDAEIDRAEVILNACGAVDIDERSTKWRAEGWESPAASGSMATSAATHQGTAALPTAAGLDATPAVTPTGDTRRLDIVEEELQVGKRVVSRGGARVYSRVVEVPVEGSVNLTEERATIVRRPVDRPATEADLGAFKEGTLELRDTSEEVVVGKSARVVEEVEIGKEVTHRDQTVHDTVRKTEVDVERVPADSTVGTTPSTGLPGTPSSDKPRNV